MTFENLSSATSALINTREAHYATHKDALDTMRILEEDVSALNLIQRIQDAFEQDNAETGVQMPETMQIEFNVDDPETAEAYLNIFDGDSGEMVAWIPVENNDVRGAERAVNALGGRQEARDSYRITKLG